MNNSLVTPNERRHVMIVTSEFPPEPGVCGRMCHDLALELAARGHQVSVVCPFPSRPMGVTYPNYHERRLFTENAGPVPVIRVPSFVSPESRLFPRIWESWNFGQWSARMLARSAVVPDVVYSCTWPMLGQYGIARQTEKMGIAHIMQIMDLYPESALPRVPAWVRAVTGGFLLQLDARNALQADRVLVISENMRETYVQTRKVPPERLRVLHTWQDEAMFMELPDRARAGRHYGIRPDLFTFLYLGNIGPTAGVERLVRAFAEAGLQQSQLLIIGGGSEKEHCIELARQTKAAVHFLSDSSIANVPLLQSLADVCLLPVRRGSALTSIPSKLSSYMLSAKPVLASVDADSESARIIRGADCGWVLEPDHETLLAAKMREVSQLNPAELEQRGHRGRAHAMKYLSKTQGLNCLTSIVLDIARRTHSRPRRGA